MNWAIAGLVYAGACAALMTQLADHATARLVAGNIALLLPPLAPLYVVATRRPRLARPAGRVLGRDRRVGALWFVGQIGWAADELLRATPMPWFKWHIVLQLCGSALPLIALVAWPHRPAPEETAITVAIDIAVLAFLTGFLYWSLIIAPANNPAQAVDGAAIARDHRPDRAGWPRSPACCWRRRPPGTSAWAEVYRRLALGMGLAFADPDRCCR